MEFVDRVSAYPGRYLMTDANGNQSYVILERADEPTTPGTPLNAETFNEMSALISAKAAKGLALTREKCVARSDGSFKSQTTEPLFFIVTIKRTYKDGSSYTYISVPVEWNICGRGELGIVKYFCGQVLIEKDSNGICTFTVNGGESDYTHSIFRVDGYM